MDKLKFVRVVGTESINFTLQAKNRDLGYVIDTVDNSDRQTNKVTPIRYHGQNRLSECISFDPKQPYIVGVNGVLNITGDIVAYKIDDTTFNTNVVTGETIVEIVSRTKKYTDTACIREVVGITTKPQLNTIEINRGKQTVVESFSRLKNMESLNDFKETGFGYYKIYNQTI